MSVIRFFGVFFGIVGAALSDDRMKGEKDLCGKTLAEVAHSGARPAANNRTSTGR